MGYQYQAQDLYFITYKTINGELFFDNQEKKRILKQQIEKTQKENLWQVLVYSVLSNHYHLIARCVDRDLMSKAIQVINGGSSYLLHKLDGSNKPVWDNDKFNWMIVVEDKLNVFMGYVLGNPLKHGLVSNLDELSSYELTNYNEAIKEPGKDFINTLILSCPKEGFEDINC